MSTLTSEPTRRRISQSLPMVTCHKEALIEAMEASLQSEQDRDEAFGQSEITAMILVELLIDRADRFVATGRFGPLDGLIEEHEALGIGGRHYSRFGDSLVPHLIDALGPRFPQEVAAAWCDLFWAVVREAEASRSKVTG